LEKVFEMVWWRGTKWNHIKKNFWSWGIFHLWKYWLPLLFEETLGASFLFFLFFNTFSSSFSLCFFYAPCLKDLGVLMILEKKNHFFNNFFSNEMVWTGKMWISAMDAYSGMELCMPIWLNHDHEDGWAMDISAVDAYYGVEVCTPIFLIRKSFSKNLQNSNGHIP
jgi:hypothetical protein